jgi:plasmid stabilization system protein ParE
MAARVIFLDQAKDDIRSLLEYIEARSPRAANSYVAGLHEVCRKLADFPSSGRPFADRYRVAVFRNHLIFYRWESEVDLVLIVMVEDGRRDDIERLVRLTLRDELENPGH